MRGGRRITADDCSAGAVSLVGLRTGIGGSAGRVDESAGGGPAAAAGIPVICVGGVAECGCQEETSRNGPDIPINFCRVTIQRSKGKGNASKTESH